MKKLTDSQHTDQPKTFQKTDKPFIALIVVGSLLLLLVAIFFPLATIWALNTLFATNINFNFFTWLAAVILIFTLQGALKITKR